MNFIKSIHYFAVGVLVSLSIGCAKPEPMASNSPESRSGSLEDDAFLGLRFGLTEEEVKEWLGKSDLQYRFVPKTDLTRGEREKILAINLKGDTRFKEPGLAQLHFQDGRLDEVRVISSFKDASTNGNEGKLNAEAYFSRYSAEFRSQLGDPQPLEDEKSGGIKIEGWKNEAGGYQVVQLWFDWESNAYSVATWMNLPPAQ